MTMLKIVAEELGFGRERRRERAMATHIPYLRHLADTVIGLESGAILSVIKLNGLFFQTEDQAELNMRLFAERVMPVLQRDPAFSHAAIPAAAGASSSAPGVFVPA